MDAPALFPGLILQHLKGGEKKSNFSLSHSRSFLLALRKKQTKKQLHEMKPPLLPIYTSVYNNCLLTELEGHLFQEASTELPSM